MNPQRKVPVRVFTGFLSSGNTTLLNQILAEQRGTGRVRGPEKGYVRCGREYPTARRQAQQSRQ